MEERNVYTIDEAIDNALEGLKDIDPKDKEFLDATKGVRELMEAKRANEKPKNAPSADAVLNSVVTMICFGGLLVVELAGHYIWPKASWVMNRFRK